MPKEPGSIQVQGSKGVSSRGTSRSEEAVSTMTNDALMLLRKNFFFPSDLVVTIPRRSERARSPPPGYFTVYEMSLRAGLRFPLAPELIAILTVCEICLSQLSCRGMTIVMGLIAFFKERGARLTPEVLARIGRFTCDAYGRVTFRSKMLDFKINDPSKFWVNSFFFVNNEWGFLEKWGILKELPPPLHVSKEDVWRAVKMNRFEDFEFTVRYVNKFVKEDFLSKVCLSVRLKKSPEKLSKGVKNDKRAVEPPLKIALKHPPVQQEKEAPFSKKRKTDGDARKPSSSKLPKIHILEDVLNHSCTGFLSADALMSQIGDGLREWNQEFVKIKFLHGEYQRLYGVLYEENQSLELDLASCRTELSNTSTSFSVHCQEADRTRSELIESRAEVTDLIRTMKSSDARISYLEAENARLQSEISESTKDLVTSKIIKDFKESYEFKKIIQDNVENERRDIFEKEVKACELQSFEDGFIRGFLKGTRLVQRRTGANIEGITWSQVSEDPSPDLEDDAESVMPSGESSDDEVVSV